ncbi:MAG: DUF421 domain-containing protein [Tenericutes bacterium]|nr:DUF421 domain-containing protein [Mycoplasmatota bacterium]
MKYLLVFGKSLFFYLLITVVYRIMGKREIGELSIMDFIVSIFIAELAAISIENYNDNMFLSIIPIAVLVVLQIFSAKLSLKSENVRSLIDGNPSVIINRGKVNFEEMLKQRYNLDDLLTQLRAKSIKSIEEVDYAILETSGKLSIFKREDDKNHTYPLPVIIDGKIQEDVLIQIGKDKKWIEESLKKEEYLLDDIFYGFYRNKRLFLIRNENIK